MKILIVDDSKAMRMIVRRTLRQAGFGHCEIEEAGNGVEALTSIRSAEPDLILCDWNMPEMNGMELLQTMNSEKRSINFGFVTTEGSADMKKNALDSGALFLITKPFTADTFRDTLTPYLS